MSPAIADPSSSPKKDASASVVDGGSGGSDGDKVALLEGSLVAGGGNGEMGRAAIAGGNESCAGEYRGFGRSLDEEAAIQAGLEEAEESESLVEQFEREVS